MPDPATSAAPLRRALRYLRPHRRSVAFILVMTLAAAVASALEPLVMKRIVDGLGNGGGVRRLLVGIGLLIGLTLVREALTGLTNWLTWRARLAVHTDLLDATVERVHTLPVGFHRQQGVGALMTRLDRGIQGFLGAITELAFNVLPALVYLAIALVIMIDLQWRLALLVLAFAPLPGVIAALAAKEQTERERTLLDRWAKIYGRFNEVLSGIVTVRSFSMEDEEKRRFMVDVKRTNSIVVRGVGRDSRVLAVQGLVVAAARISAIAVGGGLVLAGQATLGTLVAFLGYLTSLFGPVQGLTSIYSTLRKGSVALQEVFSILDAHDNLGDAPDAHEPGALRGEVEFSNVSFDYQTGGRPVIDAVNLRVRPGQRIALVGPSGAGKSTLMALLQRFYDPSSGSIRFDGWDLRELKQRSVRRQIGVVLQDAVLFDDTVAANICYGRPRATRADMIAAAKAANAHDFIERLPLGYDTPVGEKGSRLSGGERQRIAIARALLKNPPILILDEATSALDAESEDLVQQALEHLVRGRTTFVIAHRLSTVVHADRILVLRNGRIEEAGRHEELMRAGGYYASLVRRQTQGLLAPLAA